jgi:hypothetical protein
LESPSLLYFHTIGQPRRGPPLPEIVPPIAFVHRPGAQISPSNKATGTVAFSVVAVKTLQNATFLAVCLLGMPREESDVEALIAEHHDDFFRIPEIQTSRLVMTSRRFVRAHLIQFQFG